MIISEMLQVKLSFSLPVLPPFKQSDSDTKSRNIKLLYIQIGRLSISTEIWEKILQFVCTFHIVKNIVCDKILNVKQKQKGCF